MHKLFLFLIIIGFIGALSWFSSSRGPITGFVQEYIENGEFVTFKTRYTAEQILDLHRGEVLLDAQHSLQEPVLKFHPYLLMEVKYAPPDRKSREGMLLWSLVDGEMVISTDTWEKSHGFEDAIDADANRNDFRIMQALAKNKGTATVDQLQKEMHLEKEILFGLIEHALANHLIIQKGNELQLHFQDPKILVQPETKMTDYLVKKPYNHSQRVLNKYSSYQIQKIAKAAFGDDFTIRNTTEVFLPVYNIDILDADGSTLTSFWNALTGKKITPRYSVRW